MCEMLFRCRILRVVVFFVWRTSLDTSMLVLERCALMVPTLLMPNIGRTFIYPLLAMCLSLLTMECVLSKDLVSLWWGLCRLVTSGVALVAAVMVPVMVTLCANDSEMVMDSMFPLCVIRVIWL